MAIISTETVAAPADADAGAVTSVADTADDIGAITLDDVGLSDLAILAEVEAAQGTAVAPGAVEAEAVEGAGTAAETAETAEEPAAAIAAETPEVKRARAILASANKKLARANATRAQVAATIRAEIVAGLKTKPNQTLRELGLSIGEVLDAEPGGDAEAAAPKTAEDRIAAIEARAAAAEEAVRVAATNAQVAQLTETIHAELKASKDFPRINAANKGQGARGLVTDLMVEYHAVHGKALPAAEAAKQVEEFLAELAGGAPISTPKSTASPQRTTPQQRQGSQTLANNEIRNVGPGPDDLPLDPDARVAAVMKEMGLSN